MPLVSLVVPVGDGAQHLRECLDSIVAQTMLDLDVVVVDASGDDDTTQVVHAYVNRNPRFRRVTSSGASGGAARNAGLDAAEGEYILFLDPDAVLAPSTLERLHRTATSEEADVILTASRAIDPRTGADVPDEHSLRSQYLPSRGPFSPDDVSDYLLFAADPRPSSMLVRHGFLRDTGLRFSESPHVGSSAFTYLVLSRAERLSQVAEPLVWRRSTGRDSGGTALALTETLQALESGLRQSDLLSRRKRAFANVVITQSFDALDDCASADAFGALHRAVREQVFPRYGIAELRRTELLAPWMASEVEALLTLSAEAWLFRRMQQIAARAGDAEEQARRSAQELEASYAISSARTTASRLLAPEGATELPPAAAGSDPDVTVIIPVYNAEQWLHECLAGVLAQTGLSVEVVCVNDGSTDRSAKILHEYAQEHPRFVVLDMENAGQSAARNAGMKAATGRYVCFLDSDDYWRLDALSSLVRRADADALDVLLFDAEAFRDAGVDDDDWDSFATYYQRSQEHGTVRSGVELMAQMRATRDYRPSPCLYLVRRDLLEAAQLSFYPGVIHEDNLFTFTLMLEAGRAAHERTTFYARRVRPGSTMTASAQAASMRGYFVSYLGMLRQVAGRTYPPEIAHQLGDIVYGVYASTRNTFTTLPGAIGDEIRDVDPAPDAQAAYLALRFARGQAQQLAHATFATPGES